jgi:hypothetical protein
MRFLCDEMLKELAKWLRAAGHDTVVLADGTEDRTLVAAARSERRLLLTRDRKIIEHKAAVACSLLLESNELGLCVAELSAEVAIDWLYRPFSRCLSCNTLLVEATAAGERVPDKVRRAGKVIRSCPTCKRDFWEGSHVASMREQLEYWAAPDYPTGGRD